MPQVQRSGPRVEFTASLTFPVRKAQSRVALCVTFGRHFSLARLALRRFPVHETLAHSVWQEKVVTDDVETTCAIVARLADADGTYV